MALKTRKIIIIVTISLLITAISVAGLLIRHSYQSYPHISYDDGSRTSTLDALKQTAGFWINEVGPAGPVISGPKQNPFICTTMAYGLGQPLIDHGSGNGRGIAVFPELFGMPLTWLKPIGYSKNCSIYTRVDYFYYSKDEERFLPLKHQTDRPSDLALITREHDEIPFIVRLERGTINRFIYSIAMLAPFEEPLESPQQLNNSAWNGNLVYKFQGGIGIGHFQGRYALNKWQALHKASLERGYAVAYSTGTRTTSHYNMQLSAETAIMVKNHFEATYGTPHYTIGVGGSGGAIQQHLLAENYPGIIDAAITQAAFPDMITQTIPVADCELLERYFDIEYKQNKNSIWADWSNRELIEGTATNAVAEIKKWQQSPAPKPGASVCVAAWRGVIPALFNPHWTSPAYLKALKSFRVPTADRKDIRWTHWNDLQNIYPTDENGYAANSWDNVGVQYGLLALKSHDISKQDFLDLNACVGGWKQPQEMTLGNYPWNPDADPKQYDPWDQINMNLSAECKNGRPAPRTSGNIESMQIAYRSGHVFTGHIDIPVIDVRWYLEPVLDMHGSIASFASRARIKAANGHADNHVIWMTSCNDIDPVNLQAECDYEPTGDALDVMEQWLVNMVSAGTNSVVAAKPAQAADSCFNADRSLIYAGDDAWNGILDDKPAGTCTKTYPAYSNSRIQAGADIKGDLFKCPLKPVRTAIENGTYGDVRFSADEIARLQLIFPDGVCDYSGADQGRPLID